MPGESHVVPSVYLRHAGYREKIKLNHKNISHKGAKGHPAYKVIIMKTYLPALRRKMIKPCFLIVDTDLRWATNISLRLEDKFNVLVALNGKEAISRFSAQPASMVLLDLNDFSDMSGLEVLTQIRGKSNTAKILIVTSKSTHELAINCANFNVAGFLTKPIDPHILIERINKIAGIGDPELLKILWGSEYEKRVNALSRTVKKAVDFIHWNFQSDFSRDELSDHINVSPDYLSRLFHQECGLRLKDYITKLRICKSKELLAMYPDMKLKEIAVSVGFSDVNYFSRFFKKHTGLTCNEFRRNLPT